MFLSPLSSKLPSPDDPTSGEVPVPAPHWFRGIEGEPHGIAVSKNFDYIRAVGNTAARQAGLRYEEKVQHALLALLPQYSPSPSLTWADRGGARLAIPDGVLFTNRSEAAVLFEIKYSHVPDAWWQLEKKYKPLLLKYINHPNARVRCIEICRTFDSAVPFPSRFQFIPDIERLLRYIEGEAEQDFAVFQWRP